jgi:DNA-directed RNA polymerase specialized sigma24 family protein
MPLFTPFRDRARKDRVRAAFDDHYDAVWRFLRRMGVADSSVEDAAQQVLVVFSRRVNGVAPGAERAFLLSTAYRIASDFRKKPSLGREEWVGPRLPDIPEAPIELPNIVITDRSGAEDVTPAKCSRASRRTAIRFVNERTKGVSVVFWVDDDCKEQVNRRMEPGETWETETFVAHPWRVRDEKGGLLVDYVPDVPDETVYVSLP